MIASNIRRDGSGNLLFSGRSVAELAEKYDTDKAGISLAWLLRHPAGMQVLAGTSKEERLVSMIKASEIVLSREEWYAIYLAAGNILP